MQQTTDLVLRSLPFAIVLMVIVGIRWNSKKLFHLNVLALEEAYAIKCECEERLKTYIPHILDHTTLTSTTEHFRLGLWKKRFRPVLLVELDSEDDAPKTNIAIREAIKDYMSRPKEGVGHRYRPLIHYKIREEKKHGE